ncbi:methyl-accepting chemotaxis protein [Hankyongella ginsenosidimutans]|uniref:Methyl-accepting chemotaxis protein n=1 Tax=Hankyongella ginsenosidimutans TaxID=1763828 RepID=A0A4D7CBK5_9SPHN|nr:HAMP domain-containing methyl-accepting chemotaxis protein [Hankyongella ginsenosidimutans]QCI79756.1 methyl-accepting chemotaxis protein [Hankyongella ginsenosidimutans]
MIAWYLRRTLKPLTEIAHTTRALAEGRLDMDVPSQGRTDEVGEIARALDALRDALVERNRLEAEAAQAAQELQELEKNRITEQLALQSAEAGRRAEEQAAAAEQRKEFVASLAGTMEHQVAESMDRVTQALQELGQASETMRQGASATLASCALAADKSNIACENIEAIAAATEEMSASVREIERKIGVAAVEIEKAARQTSESTQTIASLSQASHRIGAVVELIQDIAEQTNLLALNATIEAARAGDAGRGFAVVASEVKGLATQTAKATQDISVLIGEIQAHTERSVATMGAVAQQVETVHEISSEISAAVREQAASTAEISRSTRVVVETVDVLNDEVENIKALAQAADQQAGAVVSSTTMLDAQSTSMASELAARLRDLRAA